MTHSNTEYLLQMVRSYKRKTTRGDYGLDALADHSTPCLLTALFFKSLKSNYRHAIESGLITNRNRRVALTDVVAIFGSAYNRAVTILGVRAINGFRVTGIWPVDEHIFDQELHSLHG